MSTQEQNMASQSQPVSGGVVGSEPSAEVALMLAAAQETAEYLRERSGKYPKGDTAGITLLVAAQGWEWFEMRLQQTASAREAMALAVQL